jgi:hypothetical protein
MAKISDAEKQQLFDALIDWMVPGASKVTHEEAVAYIQAEWIRVLTQLWDAIGKVADKKQLAVYVKELGCIPLGVLEQVVSRLLAKHTYHTVPTVGDIWAETWLVMGNSTNGSVDADYLKWQLANWTPAPRVDKYADITAMLPEVAE